MDSQSSMIGCCDLRVGDIRNNITIQDDSSTSQFNKFCAWLLGETELPHPSAARGRARGERRGLLYLHGIGRHSNKHGEILDSIRDFENFVGVADHSSLPS